MLLAHLPQVRLIAANIRERLRFSIDLDDLMGYGVIGLLKAIERFDPSRGILLKTYAEHRIRGDILDGLRKMDWLSRSAREKERLYKAISHSNATRSQPGRSLVAPSACRMTPGKEVMTSRRMAEQSRCGLIGLPRWLPPMAEAGAEQ